MRYAFKCHNKVLASWLLHPLRVLCWAKVQLVAKVLSLRQVDYQLFPGKVCTLVFAIYYVRETCLSSTGGRIQEPLKCLHGSSLVLTIYQPICVEI